MQNTLYDRSFEHDACGIGMISNIKGQKSNKIVQDAIKLLINLDHRGARGADTDTGDGAGILLQVPHKFFKAVCDFELPNEKEYAVGMLFTSHYEKTRKKHFGIIKEITIDQNLELLGFRKVPTNPDCLGAGALDSMPSIYQMFVKKTNEQEDIDRFERQIYILRKMIEKKLRKVDQENDFYICSLSAKTIVYKGMLIPDQIDVFYPDLKNKLFLSAIALVHSRFSTNTFPSWQRAHPNRMIIHNGEINTIKGNVKWIQSREKNIQSPYFTKLELEKILPVIDTDGSDSAMFDNTFEFLNMNGYDLAHALVTMIPEPWENNKNMSKERKAFYEYHSFLMEPWDGPAAMAFTDGEIVGASLDRNGLRPSRYYVTKDDEVILASEAGVLDTFEKNIKIKQRLMPGKLLIIDTKEGRIVEDEEVKKYLTAIKPYKKWIDESTLNLEDIDVIKKHTHIEKDKLRIYQRAFGYTFEDLNKVIKPMAVDAKESIGSMGNDAPLAVLSKKPQLLYNYFKQLFAQVTNPPIDSIREEIITGAGTSLGSDGNLLDPGKEACTRIRIDNPILTNNELDKIKALRQKGFTSRIIDITYNIDEGEIGLEKALERIFAEADSSITDKENILILSDRNISKEKGPMPALLAVSALNQHLVRNGKRTRANIIVETAEARETHHFALLIGYGASAINPYLAFENIFEMINNGMILLEKEQAVHNYTKAALKGIIKILSKMGISTIKSYRGSQIFECIGIKSELINKHFTGTVSRIEGIGLDSISYDVKRRCKLAYEKSIDEALEAGGDYQYRDGEEYHMYNPESIYLLQQAVRNNDYEKYREYTNLIYDNLDEIASLRSLLKFKKNTNPIPIDEVESEENIFKRFKTGAMSYGSISKEAHECMAIAMNRLGGRSNSGEGGEDPERFKPLLNKDSKCSRIKQVASGRFGVNIEYLNNADEIQIKMAQGAKPGEGGHLPGEKVYPWIAKVRNSTPGVGLISPPPHHDIYSIEDLAQLIHDLKNANKDARISVKLVSEAGVGTVAAGVAKGKADLVLISGYDGGTGAAPRTSVRHAGLPWELGLSEAHQTLLLNNLRSRIVIETDGKLMTGRDVITACLLGAEEFGFATAPLVVLGCIMMRVCNLDTCPVGVATQNPELRKCFKGKPEHLENFFRFIAKDMREIMAKLGFKTINEMVGRVDKFEIREDVKKYWKYKDIDLSALIGKPDIPGNYPLYCKEGQNHNIEKTLDYKTILPFFKEAIDKNKSMQIDLDIHNTNRTVATLLSGYIAKKYGLTGMKEDTLTLNFNGSAGQSFGAFAIKGISLNLNGDANDYIGKGLSGAKIVVKPPKDFESERDDNILIGNVALYGAIAGQAYFAGVGGERFAVRNSGAISVVEGVGDHGCEYMTGGKVYVLGNIGVNFAAGMSGGIAYIFDEDNKAMGNINEDMIEIEKIKDSSEIEELKHVLQKHVEYTESKKAKKILENFDEMIHKFIKVIPIDYKRMTLKIKEALRAGLSPDEAKMQAFYENINQKN